MSEKWNWDRHKGGGWWLRYGRSPVVYLSRNGGDIYARERIESALNHHEELVAALEAIYTTAIEPDATFSEGAFRDAILNSRALLARIKGESNGDS